MRSNFLSLPVTFALEVIAMLHQVRLSNGRPSPPSFSSLSGNYTKIYLFFTHIIKTDNGLELTLTMDENEANLDTWFGFRIVGDNLDKNVKPRNHRIGHGTSSLHFFILLP